MPKIERHHLFQVLRYLCSGFTAAGLELGSYQLMLWAGMWYLLAAAISTGIGTITAFLGHKYFVFRKRERTRQQAARFIIQQLVNAAIQVFLVYCFVDLLGIDPTIAKILGIGATVSWNFFIYKFLVYV